MAVFETVTIKNEKGEPKVIRKSDYDPKKHELIKAKAKKLEEKDKEKQHVFGAYQAQETEAKGWWEVIHTETKERQNEKNLREDDAIALAQKLGG